MENHIQVAEDEKVDSVHLDWSDPYMIFQYKINSVYCPLCLGYGILYFLIKVGANVIMPQGNGDVTRYILLQV